MISEPRQGDKSFNRQYFSHKFHSAGLSYELGISVFTNQVVWTNGPFPAGTADITIYRKGLKDKIPEGKRVIGDAGYRGEPKTISVPNQFDSKELRKFKVSVVE